MMRYTAALAFLSTVAALNNGVGQTPAMGWNSWNHFGCNVNETIIRNTADQLVNGGYLAAGYQYVNIDDCWSNHSRAADGSLQWDNTKFPSGIPALVQYVNGKGLKLGIYTDESGSTCAGYPGSYGYETQDAKTFSSWGIEYVKNDHCGVPTGESQGRYQTFRDALASTSGKPILFSMCSWGYDSVWQWGSTVGNSWRVTGDIGPSYGGQTTGNCPCATLNCTNTGYDCSFQNIVDKVAPIVQYSVAGGFNDLDMLEVGNSDSLTIPQQQMHMSFWTALKSPLIIGADLTSISDAAKSILLNKDALAISQTSGGNFLTRRLKDQTDPYQLWGGKLTNTDYVAILWNRQSTAQTLSFNFGDIGIGSGSYNIKDIWAGTTTNSVTNSYSTSVESDGVAYLRLSPS